jgi:hypothetical protein
VKWIIILLFAAATAEATVYQPLNIRTTDGSVSNYPYQLKVTTGTLIDNMDGTMTLLTGGSGGGGGGGNVTTCGTNPVGIQYADANNCLWCTTVATTGNLVTTLLSCGAVARPCTTGMSLGLLLAITCP